MGAGLTEQPLDLDALQALADAATPGPWEWSPDIGDRDLHGWSTQATVAGHYGWSDADAEFVAAARSAVPALIERVRRAEMNYVAAVIARTEDAKDHIDDSLLAADWLEGMRKACRDLEAMERRAEAAERRLRQAQDVIDLAHEHHGNGTPCSCSYDPPLRCDLSVALKEWEGR